ncbi:FimV/HubP family polar landmark protein [Marinomonas epiphytica]
MLKKTLISMAVSGLLYSSSSYALELGELTSSSNLDEPYSGQITLTDVGNLTANDILVRLGSEAEFRQAGITPTRSLLNLKFDVVQQGGRLLVNVSTDEPLQVDQLNFVLAARWPSGQVVRQYLTPVQQTALIDKSQSDVVQSATQSNTNTVLRDAAASAKRMSSQAEMDVVKGNTLWSIASQNRPTSQLSIYQTMMAIQALNEEAFTANNINLLKEGAILRLPTQEQIALFNRTMSKQEFDRQHQAWMAMKANGNLSAVEQAQLNTQAQSNQGTSETTETSDKLTLASGQSLLPEDSASSNSGDGEAINDLQNELSATQELLDKEQREKADLSDQLGELNKQLATLEQLISLKDQQMAELQLQFSQAQQALQEQKNTVDQLLEADQMRREKEQAEANSLFNKIFGNSIIVSIGAVVLILLGFLAGLLIRRSGKKKAEQAKQHDEFDLAAPAAAATTAAVAADAFAGEIAEPEPEAFEEEVAQAETPTIEDDPFAFDFNEDEDIDDDIDVFDDEIEPTEEVELDEFEFSEEDELEAVSEEEVDELDDVVDEVAEEAVEEPEDEIPTVEADDEFDISAEPESEEISDEEEFVSSLLNDVDQEDADEQAVFDQAPDEALANSIEENLAEAQADDIPDAPTFGEEEATNEELESDDEEEFDFFDASGDEVATKLDLARAYMDMGDDEGARVIFEDVIKTGNEQQIAEAQSMMERMFPSE